MQGFKESFADLKDNTGGLIDNYVKLAKVQVAEKSSNGISFLIVGVLSLILLIFFLLFIGIAAGIWIGNLIENEVAGFLIMAGIYLLLAILLIVIRKPLILPMIAKSIIKKIYG